MAKSQDWATRITHEASLHDSNCFLTLTYNDEHYPERGSVSIRELQLFHKRARKKLGRMRFFACGEYGDQNWRAHYHVILFGQDFSSDRTLHRISPGGHPLYRSPTLEILWPYGFAEIGTVTHQSAAYVSRYVLKKVTGRNADSHYSRPHPVTGEFTQLRPEFIIMSNKPGIGADWYDKYSADCFPSDFLILDGRRVPVPKAYMVRHKRQEERNAELLIAKRKAQARKHAENNTEERLAVREELQEIRAKQLKREI
ncbi:replication initiator protein [robinz microvirus RP_87]|nr:replication initiator protein [robinz microvirus RP_87]